MGGDEYIGEREQTGELVVLKDPAGEVLEEDTFLFLIHIEGDATDASGLESLDERLGLDQCAPAYVDEDSAGLHQLERARIHDMVSLGRERSVQREDIA